MPGTRPCEKAGEQFRAFGAAGIMDGCQAAAHPWRRCHAQGGDRHGTQKRLSGFRPSPRVNPRGRAIAGANGTFPAQPQMSPPNLKPGYLRRKRRAVRGPGLVTEYWTSTTFRTKDEVVYRDHQGRRHIFLSRPYLTSSDFQKLPTSAGGTPPHARPIGKKLNKLETKNLWPGC